MYDRPTAYNLGIPTKQSAFAVLLIFVLWTCSLQNIASEQSTSLNKTKLKKNSKIYVSADDTEVGQKSDEKKKSIELLSCVVHTLALCWLVHNSSANTAKFRRNIFARLPLHDKTNISDEALFEGVTVLCRSSGSALGPDVKPLPMPRETDKSLLQSIWSQLQLLQSSTNGDSLLCHAIYSGYAYQFFNAPTRKNSTEEHTESQ